jgi:hypothetical protein
MRRRKWVLVLAAVLITVLAGGYFGWRLSGAEEKIRQILLARIRPFLAQESDIQKLDVDLRSLHLRGVKLAPKDRSFRMEIQEVRLGMNLWNLIRYGLAPHKLSHNVTLIHPVLTLQSSALLGSEPIPAKEWVDLSSVVEALEAVRRITLVDAELQIADSLGQSTRLAHTLSGWMNTAPADSARIRLSGQVFDSHEDNLFIQGRLDLPRGRVRRLQVTIREFTPSQDIPLLLPGYLQVDDGTLQGEFFFGQDLENSGNLTVSNGALSFKGANLSMEGVHIESTLKGNDVAVEGRVESFNGSPLEISGSVQEIFNPDLNLTMNSSHFDIGSFFKEIITDARVALEGDARFTFHLTGASTNPRMEGRFASSEIKAYGVVFNDFQTRMGLQDSVFTLTGKGSQSEGVELALEGAIDFSNPAHETDVTLDILGDLAPSLTDLIRRRLNSFSTDLQVRLTGPLEGLRGSLAGEMHARFTEGFQLNLIPDVTYSGRRMNLSVSSNGRFALKGHMDSPFREGLAWQVEMRGGEDVLVPLLFHPWSARARWHGVKGTFSGRDDQWTLLTEIRDLRKRGEPKNMELRVTSGRQEGQWRQIRLNGEIYGRNEAVLPLEAVASLAGEELVIHGGRVGEFFTLEGHYPLKREGSIHGNVRFSGINLEKLHDFIPELSHYTGEIRGRAEFGGKPGGTTLNIQADLHNGLFHGQGLFDGQFKYRVEEETFHSAEVSFSQNGSVLFSGSARRTKSDSLEGGFQGEIADIKTIFQAVTGHDYVSGRGSVDIRVGGGIRTPRFYGTVSVEDGSLWGMSYQGIHTEVVDSIDLAAGPFSGRFSIVKGRIDRSDGLRVLFWGDIYHGRDRDSDVSVLAEGNLLGPLQELSPFFRKTESTGELFLRWGGRRGDWSLGSGRVWLENGTIQPSDFLGKIENIRGTARLDQENRFMKIENLTAVTEGQEFEITNRLPGDENGGVEPLSIPVLGMQLGVLMLKTEGKGLHTHLPGLMEKGEKGWIVFKGLDEADDYFVIAGPAQTPLLRGSLVLHDMQLTYPFLPVEEDGEVSQTMEMLRSVNWDLQVLPMKDVHYIRNMETPLGNVNADLLLRDELGGMRLQGVIRDGEFQVSGSLLSTEGSLTVLDHYFKPERITMDYPRGADNPIISGRAHTTVTDSMGMPSTVWLVISAVDEETGMEYEAGSWEHVQFRFTTDNPNLGRSQADLLAALGYSTESIKDRAYDALGTQVENLVFRPLFRPIERGIKRHLGLDVVQLHSMFSRNLVQLQSRETGTFDARWLLRSTKLTLGKYITPDIFLLYSGQVQSSMGVHYATHGIGIRHALSLEYTIRPDLLLQMEYMYDSQLLSDRREDKRIWLRHVFPF